MLTRSQVNPNGSGCFPRQDSPPAEKDSHKTLNMLTTHGFILLHTQPVGYLSCHFWYCNYLLCSCGLIKLQRICDDTVYSRQQHDFVCFFVGCVAFVGFSAAEKKVPHTHIHKPAMNCWNLVTQAQFKVTDASTPSLNTNTLIHADTHTQAAICIFFLLRLLKLDGTMSLSDNLFLCVCPCLKESYNCLRERNQFSTDSKGPRVLHDSYLLLYGEKQRRRGRQRKDG